MFGKPTFYNSKQKFLLTPLRVTMDEILQINAVSMCKFRSTFVWLSGMSPAFRCNYSWFTTRRSSPASVAAFPGLPSATGRVSFGRPVSPSRTLTAGLLTKGPRPTALCWEDAGR